MIDKNGEPDVVPKKIDLNILMTYGNNKQIKRQKNIARETI